MIKLFIGTNTRIIKLEIGKTNYRLIQTLTQEHAHTHIESHIIAHSTELQVEALNIDHPAIRTHTFFWVTQDVLISLRAHRLISWDSIPMSIGGDSDQSRGKTLYKLVL